MAALNVPAAARLRQLKTNYTRLAEHRAQRRQEVHRRQYSGPADRGGRERSRRLTALGCGRQDRPARRPILRSAIHELNFNPVWHLPPTVIDKDLIPKGQEMAQRGQDVLSKYNIDAYGGDGKKLNSTQDQLGQRRRARADLPAAAGAGQSARLRQDQFPQQLFRLHARLAVAIVVRAQLPCGELGLRARAGRRAARRLARAGAGLVAGARAGDEEVRASAWTCA